MTSPSDYPAFEARLDFVHARLLELHARVASLEAQLHGRAPAVTSPPPSPPPTMSPIAAQTVIAPVPAPMSALGRDEPDTHNTVRTLAIAGGGAMLLGLACFVAYAIEQAWLTPSVRFVLAAITSALLTLVAWPIARRNYDAVAGAIGGAGLGGWFAAWLVARHAHELVSVPQAFVALAAGAAACLLIADRLRLRLMAGLAGAAACATPVLVANDGRLHELMIYQLLVIVGLLILDARRRWPELPTIGLLASWLLAGSWAAQHGPNGSVVAWSSLLLLVSAASARRAIRHLAERDELAHAVTRLLVGGVATWSAAAAAFHVDSFAFAVATGTLSCWHFGIGALLRRREHQASELFLALGWLQAFVLGPVALEQAALACWWIAMSLLAGHRKSPRAASLGLFAQGGVAESSQYPEPWAVSRPQRGAMILIPALAAVGWSVAADQPWSLMLGTLAAATLLAASLWPRADLTHTRPVAWLALIGTLAWAVVVIALGPASMVAQLTLCLLPIAAVLGFCCVRPSPHAQRVANLHMGLGLIGLIAAVAETDALLLRNSGELPERLAIAVLLLLLAGFGAATIARTRSISREAEQFGDTATGLLTAAAVGLALLLGVASLSAGSVALGQVGYSLTAAGVGLALIVAGLRLGDGVWRQVGLTAITTAAGKIVLLDLAAAAFGWRALSFVGLGAILIGGAFAYSRAARRACASN